MHWASWDKLCCHKKDRGLGFRNLFLFNKALLAKQAWHLIVNPDSLVAQVLRNKYFPNNSFLQVSSSNSSFLWHSILWGRKLIEQGSRWCIGGGQSVSIYHNH
ncbi:hypothetical protein ACOSQ4_016290 [Xanthoceras sorbifolium]